MEQGALEAILDAVIPGDGFTRAGQARLEKGVWTIPFRHFRFGLGQIFLPDRNLIDTSDRRALAKEIGERLGLALASSQ